MTNEEKVRDFMVKAEQVCPLRPTVVPESVAVLRATLIGEELEELTEAMSDGDLLNIADALADMLYVVYGTAIAYGLPIQAIFDEVHRSNMTKFIDGHKRHDGKWEKGKSWVPPNLKQFLHKSDYVNCPHCGNPSYVKNSPSVNPVYCQKCGRTHWPDGRKVED